MLLPDISIIKKKRAELNITQKDLAQESQVSQSFIAKIESKNISPSYEIVRRILTTFERLEHKKEIICLKLISKKLISVQASKSVKEASDIMKKNAISQLPVFDCKRLIGTISESGIYNKLVEGQSQKALFKSQVKEILEDPLPTISASSPSSIAMPLLKTNPAVLLTEKEKIIGIITKEDFITKI